jgi:hypothetical protein
MGIPGQNGKWAKWDEGKTGKGRNGKMAKWQWGEMAKGEVGKGEMGINHSYDMLYVIANYLLLVS